VATDIHLDHGGLFYNPTLSKEARVSMDPSIPPFRRGMLAPILEPGTTNKNESWLDFIVGDIDIPLNDVVPGKEESQNQRDLFGDVVIIIDGRCDCH
jgi:hypothetical protein